MLYYQDVPFRRSDDDVDDDNAIKFNEHRSVDGHKIVIAMKDADVFSTMGLCNNAASTICDIVWTRCDKKTPR